MGGPGGDGARAHRTPTRGTGKQRGRGEAGAGARSLTNTWQRVARGTAHEVEQEQGKGPTAGAGAVGARAPLGPGAAVGGGQAAETELFRAPNANKRTLFLHDCRSYL